jgi:hypothetical protein
MGRGMVREGEPGGKAVRTVKGNGWQAFYD